MSNNFWLILLWKGEYMNQRTQQTQRVKTLKEKFMQYHADGYTIPEIAKIFNVEYSTVYKHLDDIAKANGVTRESLLQKAPYSPQITSKAAYQRDKVDMEELQKSFTNLKNDLNEVINQLEIFLEQTKE